MKFSEQYVEILKDEISKINFNEETPRGTAFLAKHKETQDKLKELNDKKKEELKKAREDFQKNVIEKIEAKYNAEETKIKKETLDSLEKEKEKYDASGNPK